MPYYTRGKVRKEKNYAKDEKLCEKRRVLTYIHTERAERKALNFIWLIILFGAIYTFKCTITKGLKKNYRKNIYLYTGEAYKKHKKRSRCQ